MTVERSRNHRTTVSRSGNRTTLFLSGTDTGVGKTYVATLLAQSLFQADIRVGVYKPVETGCEAAKDGELIAADAAKLWEAAGRPLTLEQVCPQRFAAPLAPPEAAMAEGKEVDVALLRKGTRCWQDRGQTLLVEGAGGLFSPLAKGLLNIGLAQQLGARLVIVADDGLGVIHRALSACYAAKQFGVTPFGLILCQPHATPDASISSNRQQIEAYTEVPVLGRVSFADKTISTAIVEKLLDPATGQASGPTA